MKLKKGLGIFAVLLALTVTACNAFPANVDDSKGDQENSSLVPDGTSDKPAAQEKITITAAGGKTKLMFGETVQLTADQDGVSWESSKPEVATVSDSGLVTSVAKGSATIKAKKDGFKDGSINISVDYPNITITASGETSLLVGETVTLSASEEGVTWSSSDESVATVSNGVVTAVKLGSATIKASKANFNDGSIAIKVVKPAAPHLAEPTWPDECPALIDTTSWTAGTPEKNSYDKEYTPLTGPDGSVGVKIALVDADPDSASTFDSSGKLGTNSDSYVTFKLKAPKAGVYQMIIKASCSSSGDSYKFAGSSSRGFDVLINGYEDQDNVYGDRLYSDAGLDHDEKRAFVFALVQLNGPDYEDEISFRNPYYRMKFDTTGDLVFAENK